MISHPDSPPENDSSILGNLDKAMLLTNSFADKCLDSEMPYSRQMLKYIKRYKI